MAACIGCRTTRCWLTAITAPGLIPTPAGSLSRCSNLCSSPLQVGSINRRYLTIFAPPVRRERWVDLHSVEYGLSAVGRPQDASAATLPITLLVSLPLISFPFPTGEAELDFGPAAFVEVDGQRNHRHPIALDRPQQSVHLLAMEQQLTRPPWLVIEMGRG